MDRETELTRQRYDRAARVYHRIEALEGKVGARWRRRLFQEVTGPSVLEVGVGLGRNLEFCDTRWDYTGIDLSPRMLEKARERARNLGLNVDLRLGDVQELPFPDGSFDTVISTFVFCSVPHPVVGLTEVRRVLKPTGQLLMLEHVLSRMPLMRLAMDVLNPLALRLIGDNINRETVENVQKAGFLITVEENLLMDVFKFIVAEPRKP